MYGFNFDPGNPFSMTSDPGFLISMDRGAVSVPIHTILAQKGSVLAGEEVAGMAILVNLERQTR